MPTSIIIELNSKGNRQDVDWDLDPDTLAIQGGSTLKTANGEKKRTHVNSLCKTITFKLPHHHVSPEQERYALG